MKKRTRAVHHAKRAVHHVKKHVRKIPPVILIAGAAVLGYLVMYPLLAERRVFIPADMMDKPTILGMGGFTGVNGHQTTGAVTLYKEGMSNFIRIEDNFRTENVAGLEVYFLHADLLPVVRIAPLQSTSGAQTYEIPENVPVAEYDEVIIASIEESYGTAALDFAR